MRYEVPGRGRIFDSELAAATSRRAIVKRLIDHGSHEDFKVDSPNCPGFLQLASPPSLMRGAARK
jgi:hypothetical protein